MLFAMSGIAFIEGAIEHTGERHLVALLCDHNGIMPVDFRSQRCFTIPPMDVNFEHGLYTNAYSASIKYAKGILRHLSSATEQFNTSTHKHCVRAMMAFLCQSRIAFPLIGDLNVIKDEDDISARIRQLSDGSMNNWSRIDESSLVMISPAGTLMDYNHITGLLSQRLAGQNTNLSLQTPPNPSIKRA